MNILIKAVRDTTKLFVKVVAIMFISIFAIGIICGIIGDTFEQHKARIIPNKVRINKEFEVKPEHDKLGAFTIAQNFVESNLRCPRTAKWPWISYSKVTVHLGNGRYQISSYLDAQNGFGALVRINFICVVEHISGDRWRLINLTI